MTKDVLGSVVVFSLLHLQPLLLAQLPEQSMVPKQTQQHHCNNLQETSQRFCFNIGHDCISLGWCRLAEELEAACQPAGVLFDIHKLKSNRYTHDALNKPVWRELTCFART